MLKVSLLKGVIRFVERVKLNPRYIGTFKILDQIGPVAYWLRLPQDLKNVHDVFHVSNIKNCISDDTIVIIIEKNANQTWTEIRQGASQNYGQRDQTTQVESDSHSQGTMEI